MSQTAEKPKVVVISPQVTVRAFVAKEPELRYTPTGTAVVELVYAISPSKYQKDKAEDPNGLKSQWVSAKLFGEYAEVVANEIKKGDLVIISGDMQAENWWGQDGRQNVKLVLAANEVSKVIRRPKADAGKPAQQTQTPKGAVPNIDEGLEDFPTAGSIFDE